MNESRITRKYWFALLAVVLVGGLIHLSLPTRQAGKQEKETVLVPTGTNQSEAQGGVTKDRKHGEAEFANLARSAQPRTPPPPMTRNQKLDLAPNYMNVPVTFYGRVVDQDGNSLAGVRVVLSVRQWYRPPTSPGLDSVFSKSDLTTDETGGFQLLNASGDSLRIERLEKEGYEPELKSLRGFTYTSSDPMQADPSQPIIFRMWKAGVKASLITGDKFLRVIPDGRVYTFDLLNGVLVEGEVDGDLRIAIKREPDAAWGNKYDWSFELIAINGGLIEESDPHESMYLAPNDNYEKRVAMAFQPGEGWTYATSKRFYVKARNGQAYGRMDVEIQAFYLKDKQGRFGIKYAVNPLGGRTLR